MAACANVILIISHLEFYYDKTKKKEQFRVRAINYNTKSFYTSQKCRIQCSYNKGLFISASEFFRAAEWAWLPTLRRLAWEIFGAPVRNL